MELLLDPNIWIAFLTLTALEIVLGIDNIIFLSILVQRLPKPQQPSARFFGLALAMITRIALLLSITWVMQLTKPWFSLWDYDVTGRALILFFGGLFLIAKSTTEIHESLEGPEDEEGNAGGKANYLSIIVQIGLLDIVFSLDSVITAVGLVDEVPVMIAAIIIAVIVMMVSAGAISDFVERHPTVKMLALSFLIMVGFALVAESMHFAIPKGYIYFAMAFSVAVEMLNLRLRSRRGKAVHLHQQIPGDSRTDDAD